MAKMTKLTCKNIFLIPAKITHDNIYSEGVDINSCRQCRYKLYCSYADINSKTMPLCIRFRASKDYYVVKDDLLNLYFPLGMGGTYSRIIIGGQKCTN